jgi:hypothetical protein
MNASVVQNVNLAPMSVEEMESTNGGFVFLVVVAVAFVVSSCASCQVLVKHGPAHPPDSTGHK